MLDVSIIIVNWNTKDLLQNCLRSTLEQAGDVDYEIVVVDNASSDGSAEMVKQIFPQVKLIENTENHGFAAANNQGMAIAQGRYVLLLNSDTVILDNAIAKTVAFADDHPDAAVVGCRVLNPDRTLQPTCFMFPSLLNMLLSTIYLNKLFSKSRFFGRERMTWWHRNDEREVDVVTGCFMLVRQEAIKQVGMMDERFFIYGEETDWCYRLKQAGWRILFTPNAHIIHLGGASSKQIKSEMVLQLRASILLFFKKHKGRFSYGLACLLVGLFFLLRISFWLVGAIVSKRMRHSYLQTTKTYAIGTIRALLGWQALASKSNR
jgi:GT2 family glycosyltransferase